MPAYVWRKSFAKLLKLIGLLAAFFIVSGGRVATAAEQSGVPPSVSLKRAPEAPLSPPSAPQARKAYDVLKKHCARCHQAGQLSILRAAGAFGNVLRLDELARNPSRVRPGNPDASPLYTSMFRREMPHDRLKRTDKGVRPSTRDVQVIRRWIADLKKTPEISQCRRRKPVPPDAVSSAILRDLVGLSAKAAKQRRYIELSHLFNACDSPRALYVYRQAVGRLLNALSWAPNSARLPAIDANETVLRIDLADLGWDQAGWELLVGHYPYGARAGGELGPDARAMTGTQVPVVRADWLAYAATRPPLYYSLLDLPATFAGLQARLGIDVSARIGRLTAHRVAVRQSSFARRNRLLERHATAERVLWLTHEFGASGAGKDLFATPTGPDGNKAFRADGGLALFSLPNGFDAFYARDADGNRLWNFPTSLVRDPARHSGLAVTGLSCMGCHRKGVRPAGDDLRAHVQGAGIYDRGQKQRLLALHPEPSVLKAAFQADSNRFQAALVAAGLDPNLTLRGLEPVNALAARYERDLVIRQAASELGITLVEFLADTKNASGLSLWVRRTGLQGGIPRYLFERAYPALLRKLAGPSAVHAVIAPIVRDARQSIQTRNIELAVMADKDTYEPGDFVRLSVLASEACHLTLINVDASGKATVLFPNDFDRANLLSANQELQVPFDVPKYRFRIAAQGPETIVALCNATSREVYGIVPNFERQKFTELGDYRVFLGRAFFAKAQIAARRAERKPRKSRRQRRRRRRARPQKPLAMYPDVIAHTAIRLRLSPKAK